MLAIRGIIPVGFRSVGAGLGAWLVERFAPETAGSGIPRVEAVLRNHLLPASFRVLPVKFAGGVLAIGGGLDLGREGPTVQMGGTIGRLLGDGFGRFLPEPWTLTAAGTGAGLAVAFNAPLAAAIFVAEEVIRRFSVRVFVATVVFLHRRDDRFAGNYRQSARFFGWPAGKLALGALLGAVFVGACHLCHIPMELTPCAIVAMAACFTAVVRSPLTAVVLLLEMTGSWTLILPIIAASAIRPIYDSLRERDESLARQRAVAEAVGAKPTSVPLR